MISFKDIIKKKNIEYKNGYKCECCNTRNNGKPWVIYKLSEYQNNIDKNICSYLCYKKMNIKDTNLWSKVINKCDFFDLRPVSLNNCDDFTMLTNDELLELDDNSVKKYYEKLNTYYYMNPERASIQLKIMENSVSEFDNVELYDNSGESD
jgi:hypothetical protein